MLLRRVWKRSGLSYKEASNRIHLALDPLSFLNADASGIGTQDALDQIHGSMHVALEDVEKSFQMVYEQLRPDANVSDRIILEANKQIRHEQARARSLADLRQDDLVRQARIRLECLFIQGLIKSPVEEPSVRRWEGISSRAIDRNEPEVSEYSYDDLGEAATRAKKVMTWQKETDEWLETLCQNHIHEILVKIEDQIKDFINTWVEVTGVLTKRASLGGDLFREVNDPECWNFESEDPTVTNLLNGVKAQDAATRVLDRFQMNNQDIVQIADVVRVALADTPVFGTSCIALKELEELMAMAVAEKLRDTLAVGNGFLSLMSSGIGFGEEMSELLDDMRRGAKAMEEKLWRVGELGTGHVDSVAGVGVTAPEIHGIVLRGLGGGRKFEAVEGQPGNNHRLDVQMSIVGAPASDLTAFRDMVYAWYSWHFEEDRGAASTEEEWMTSIKAEYWKLYPDIGRDTGVRNAIVELIDEDLRSLLRAREPLPIRPSNGLPSDIDLIRALWNELGVITKSTA